jgi:hypothetical protein
MKFILIIPMLLSSLLLANNKIESVKVADLTVEELKKIVRLIVQDSIEKCEVNGTMNGRAKVNLKVEGEVEAKMTCDFTEYKNKE